MAKIVAILGASGDGKTTSTVINPDGSCMFFKPKDEWKKEDYEGMNPETHFIMNLDDNKDLPFPAGFWSKERGNYAVPKSFQEIKNTLISISKNPKIKSVALDTINLYLAMKEFNDRKKMSYDQWKDVANDVIELLSLCNQTLREDQIAYILGHTMMETQVDGTEKEVFSMIGKKMRKTPPEAFFSICLFTRVEYGDDGVNTHYFQTKANHNSAKSPIGMFDKYEIPNSMKLVDSTVREFYKMQ